jgi:hypothetical protein
MRTDPKEQAVAQVCLGRRFPCRSALLLLIAIPTLVMGKGPEDYELLQSFKSYGDF